MKGTIVNVIAVLTGSLLGLFFKNLITTDIKKIIMQALGLVNLVIGMSMSLQTKNPIILIFSLVLGGILGETFAIHQKIESFASFLKKKFKSKESRFVEGFISAFVIFCVGSLTILGAFEDGLNNNPTLLYTKSMLDGSTAIALSSAMGIGVLFSAIPLFIFQGSLTLGAVFLKPLLNAAMIAEMTAVGGVLVIGIGIVLLEIKKIKLSNFLPSLIIAPLLAYIFL